MALGYCPKSMISANLPGLVGNSTTRPLTTGGCTTPASFAPQKTAIAPDGIMRTPPARGRAVYSRIALVLGGILVISLLSCSKPRLWAPTARPLTRQTTSASRIRGITRMPFLERKKFFSCPAPGSSRSLFAIQATDFIRNHEIGGLDIPGGQGDQGNTWGKNEHHGWWDGGDMPEEHRDEWLESLKDRFQAGDCDGDGYLDVEELRSILECTDQFCLSRHWLPIEQVAAVMEQYDLEDKGKISFEEFVKMGDDHQLLMGVLDDYLNVFQALDRDGSGRIEKKEMRDLFVAMMGEKRVSEENIETLYKKADLNGDVETICFSEFLELIRSHTFDLQMVLDFMTLKPQAKQESSYVRKSRIEDKKKPKPKDERLGMALLGESDTPPELVPGQVAMIGSYGQLDALFKQNKTVILQVTFKWCRPCKMFAKKYATIANQFQDVVFLKMVGDENEITKAMLKRLSVRLSPTFILYQDGERQKSFSGASEIKLRSMVMGALNQTEPLESSRRAEIR